MKACKIQLVAPWEGIFALNRAAVIKLLNPFRPDIEPTMSIPHAVVKQNIPDYPGPGQYQAEKRKSTLPTYPSYSIARSRYSSERKGEAPCPGYYQVKDVEARLKKSISYTFKKSIAGSVADYSTLNPLSYHPNYDAMKARAPAYSINKSEYSFKKICRTPGPGDYIKEIKSTLNKGIVFPTSTKKTQSTCIPGPGDYHAQQALDKLTKKEPRVLIPAARETHRLDSSPGPGQYQTIISSISKCGGVIARQSRRSHEQLSPGPGEYSTDSLILKPKHPRFAIIKQKRTMQSTQRLPGPGGYNVSASYQTVLTKAPKMIIPRSQKSLQHKDAIPGPGSYIEIDTSLSKKGGVIQKSRLRKSSITVQTPGVGRYRVSRYERMYRSNKGYTIGRSRYHNPERQITPGPGDYNTNVSGGSLPQIRLKTQKSRVLRQSSVIVQSPTGNKK